MGLYFQAKQCGTTQLDEDGLFELVKTKPGKKINYEPPRMDKKSKKKEKTEVAETLSQGKEQLEGESSQLSERSTSSPATQTPTSSPAPKGTLRWSRKLNTLLIPRGFNKSRLPVVYRHL